MFGLWTWFRKVTGDDRPTLESVVNAVTAEVGRGVRRGEQEANSPGFSVSVTKVEVTLPVDSSAVRDDESSDATREADENGGGVSMRTEPGGDGKLTLTIVPGRKDNRPSEQTVATSGTDDKDDGRAVSAVPSLSVEQADALDSAGISTVTDLADASTESVASATGVSTDRGERLVVEATLLRLGAGSRTAELLASLDYTVTSLSDADPTSILERIDRAIEQGDHEIEEEYEADLAELDGLVSKAKKAVDEEVESGEQEVKGAEQDVAGVLDEGERDVAEVVGEAENAVDDEDAETTD